MSRLEKHIASLGLQLHTNGFLKALCIGLGMGLLLSVFGLPFWLLVSLGGTGLIGGIVFFGVFRDKKKEAIEILHQEFPMLEFSLELADVKQKNMVEMLQWDRINESFGQRQNPWVFQRKLWPFVLFFLMGLIANQLGTLDWRSLSQNPVKMGFEENTILIDSESKPLQMNAFEVVISPPSYTGQATRRQTDLNIKALKGAVVEWKVTFEGDDALKVALVNVEGAELEFAEKSGGYFLKDKLTGSGIYAIRAYQNEVLAFESAYHSLEAVTDKPPLIFPGEKELYRYHFQNDAKQLNIAAKVSDDFKVTEVYLVATLASGSGENVKFRETKIPIGKSDFASAELTQKLDLNLLGLKPGDELYYYWAALDNQKPEPNFSRSDTYFIHYVDTSGLEESQLPGMAIHVLPEYFRSQRQIIIDTEKLLKAKKTIAEKEFNSTSNEIGFEQKLLRMRYGQYLGEEFESTAGGGGMRQDNAENILQSFMHNHDHEGEDTEVQEEKTKRFFGINPTGERPQVDNQILLDLNIEEEHHHHHGDEEGGDLAALLEEYLHNHDSEEMNTLYEASTRSLLKMALEQMWQSELHLRLFEPEKALPFQYKALDYLKTVQQKSRVYVKRTGFDPPPIKEEEKRLKGEMKGLDKDIKRELTVVQNELSALSGAILGMIQQEIISAQDKETIQAFGRLWTERMQYSGMEDWSVLLLLQQLSSGELDAKGRNALHNKLYPLIANGKQLDASSIAHKDLQKAFWKNLK
ncbi:hypothetical protein P872_19045 [Rhodonellum psychrophilum GCM71 = DSM 17998]|uniref:Tryptophan-rich sensory protein n=2 Tax=Rhodonellum TaxID=336827 RepID=U5C279_9BACT|nr:MULTISPECIES: hypothetical protein [Rhodonellum]ERM82282.1 hypothetical protein P872_19045 [Rhodonellum psychrophilum GCM71 = DSM 17998]SDZ25353.1 hypothetical protein SAMN05444412_108133 [Rhodonellum ikkaensis]